MRKIAGYLTKYSSKKFRLSEGKASGACHTASMRNLCKWPENRPKHTRKQYIKWGKTFCGNSKQFLRLLKTFLVAYKPCRLFWWFFQE